MALVAVPWLLSDLETTRDMYKIETEVEVTTANSTRGR